ncbi:VOC family protein [Sporosarcina aquimarina]|uniref:VOC family protein n=1 Tax=Sporosarcina aquimarina TaxID=114975 RepID=A0ABU4FZF6_9BACL|nr:VOC family protein [Sporosarcina aquimarina]MDW0110099.1 VOC family protein [Sporosarcina aquimarina]
MKLDHVVYFTKRTPEKIAAQYEGAFVGGRHEKWGTYNALKYVRNAYIEWLAIENNDLAESSSHPLVTQLRQDLAAYGDGWGTLCFSTEDIGELDERLKLAGIETSGVIDASRKTSSGALKKWKMLFIEEQNNNDLPCPFFIEWEEDEISRRETLRKDGSITEQSEAECIQECVLVTENLKETVAKWSTILNVEVEDSNSLLLNGVRFRFETDLDERNRMLAVVTG